MTLRDFYLERRSIELPVFKKVLKALPKDKLDYRPHERSPSAEEIVWKLTTELKSCLDVVKERKTEWISAPPPSYEEIIEKFELWSNELTDLVSKMNEETWNSTAEFYFKGKKVSEQPIGTFLWYIHFDAIHHRGQLSTYIRPMGGKVPAIYGPSGDERS